MANFSFSTDLDKVFPKGIEDEKLALDMIKSGQEVMQKLISRATSKHQKTGSLMGSVKCSKSVINSKGDAIAVFCKHYGVHVVSIVELNENGQCHE